MNITFNRRTREVWITDAHGNVVSRTQAVTGQRAIDAAGELLIANGLKRVGDYLLVANGSPLRTAKVAV